MTDTTQVTKPKVHTMKDVYSDYAEELLRKHPEWWGKYSRTCRLKNAFIYTMNSKGKPVLKMSWPMWKDITGAFYHKAKFAIIQGETLRLGANLGKIQISRIERNFAKPVVDWPSTQKENLRDENGKLIKIYYTNEDYCRISWKKNREIPNETMYTFDPATRNMATGKGFKGEFATALKENPLLKYRYKYYPIKKRRKQAVTKPQPTEPCSTAIAQ